MVKPFWGVAGVPLGICCPPFKSDRHSLSSVKKPAIPTRSGDIIPLKEGLEALVRAYRLQGKLNEVTVVSSWERVMGKAVALKTQEVYVNKGRLFVRLSSAPSSTSY